MDMQHFSFGQRPVSDHLLLSAVKLHASFHSFNTTFKKVKQSTLNADCHGLLVRCDVTMSSFAYSCVVQVCGSKGGKFVDTKESGQVWLCPSGAV